MSVDIKALRNCLSSIDELDSSFQISKFGKDELREHSYILSSLLKAIDGLLEDEFIGAGSFIGFHYSYDYYVESVGTPMSNLNPKESCREMLKLSMKSVELSYAGIVTSLFYMRSCIAEAVLFLLDRRSQTTILLAYVRLLHALSTEFNILCQTMKVKFEYVTHGIRSSDFMMMWKHYTDEFKDTFDRIQCLKINGK